MADPKPVKNSTDELRLEQAYQFCLNLAAQHYENFPVASRFLPVRLRRPIAVIYSFARSADDLADEGDMDAQERIRQLDEYSAKLTQIESGSTDEQDPIFIALAEVIKQHQLPVSLFHDLLHAFKMDVEKNRFATFDEILHYCHYSANPVGRLLLTLYNQASDENLQYSDAICTALQLINFYQDLSQDYLENNRVYLPQDEMQQFSISESHIQQSTTDPSMLALMQKQYQRSSDYLNMGKPLGKILKGRFGFELRMIISAGERILKKLMNNQHNVFARPRLGRFDGLLIVLTALLTR
ncbi:MAG: squalene synthase HpnC [Gammaproteobacteria bacterium]|nr:squalene synthase HpnC [Gammaproteobacteria bacterium]